MRILWVIWAASLATSLATVANADDTKKASDGSYAGAVTASQLQLRAGPSESYQTVATLKKGDLVVVLGKHANDPEWLVVEVPTGYEAWVFGSFLAVSKDKTAKVTTDRLLVRPRATTRYHQLAGRLDKGETVKVVGEKRTEEGLWYKIIVPRRFPLYAFHTYLKNAGPASLAEPKKEVKKPVPAATVSGSWDTRFRATEKAVLAELPKIKTFNDIQPLRKAVAGFDSKKLNAENRDRRIVLLSRIYTLERKLAFSELDARDQAISDELRRKLQDIEERYKEKLARIRATGKAQRKHGRYTAVGVVVHAPHVFGSYPSFRLELGKQMRYYLIAPDYDLLKFVGKKVGVIGLTDRESGTGYDTVMVKRIEIIVEKPIEKPTKK